MGVGHARDFSHIPVIDVGPLVAGTPGQWAVAMRMGNACRESGFFYAVGHGVDAGQQRRLGELSRRFFDQDIDTKRRIRMALGDRGHCDWTGSSRTPAAVWTAIATAG